MKISSRFITYKHHYRKLNDRMRIVKLCCVKVAAGWHSEFEIGVPCIVCTVLLPNHKTCF